MMMKAWLGAAALGIAACTSLNAQGSGLFVNASTNRVVLKPNQAGQRIRLFLDNRSTKTNGVLAGTFTVVLAPSSPAAAPKTPRIAKAKLVGLDGSPLLETRLTQTDYPAPVGAWMAMVETLSLLPSRRVVLQPGTRWPLCDLDVDTTGITDGSVSWQIKLDGMIGNAKAKSFFNVPSDSDPKLTLEVPVVADMILVSVESTIPPVPPPVAVTLDPANGNLVFESDAGSGSPPAIEFAEDPVKGTWSRVNVSGSQFGTKWRWQVPMDPGVPARFFRSAYLPSGPTGGGRVAQ